MKQRRDYYILDIGTLWSKRGALAKKREKKHASLRVPHNFLCNNNLFLDFCYSFFFLSKNQSENKAMSSQIEENLCSTFLSGLDNIDDVNLTINVMT